MCGVGCMVSPHVNPKASGRLASCPLPLPLPLVLVLVLLLALVCACRVRGFPVHCFCARAAVSNPYHARVHVFAV